MAVQNKVLYAFRGWIAFVAFMDLGTAGRSYIERRSFLSNSGDSEQLDGEHKIKITLTTSLNWTETCYNLINNQ